MFFKNKSPNLIQIQETCQRPEHSSHARTIASFLAVFRRVCVTSRSPHVPKKTQTPTCVGHETRQEQSLFAVLFAVH